jgi:hypothetical protein
VLYDSDVLIDFLNGVLLAEDLIGQDDARREHNHLDRGIGGREDT